MTDLNSVEGGGVCLLSYIPFCVAVSLFAGSSFSSCVFSSTLGCVSVSVFVCVCVCV